MYVWAAFLLFILLWLVSLPTSNIIVVRQVTGARCAKTAAYCLRPVTVGCHFAKFVLHDPSLAGRAAGSEDVTIYLHLRMFADCKTRALAKLAPRME